MGSAGWKPAGDKPKGFDGDVLGEGYVESHLGFIVWLFTKLNERIVY